MLAYLLAILVGIGSLTLYMSAFFFPEVHRRGDFIWSGIGLFYALILWLCAGRITGAVLLGETAGVSLLLWFGWQTLLLRRDLTPVLEKTPVNSTEIAEKTSKFSGLFPKSAKQKKNVTKVKDSPPDQVVAVAETVQENIAEMATAFSDQIPTVTEVSDSLSGSLSSVAEQVINTAENLGDELSNNDLSNTAGAIASNIVTNTEEIAQVAEEKLTNVGEVVGEKFEEILPTESVTDQLVENVKGKVDEWGEVIGEKAQAVNESITETTEGAIANVQEAVKPEKKSAGFASVLKPVTGFFNSFRKGGNKSPAISKTDPQLVVNDLSESVSETVNDLSEKVTDVIADKADEVFESVKSVGDNINNLTQDLNQDFPNISPAEKDRVTANTMPSDQVKDAGIEKEIVVFEELFEQGDDSLSAEDEVSIASIDNPFQMNETIEEVTAISDMPSSDMPSSDKTSDIPSSVTEIIADQLNKFNDQSNSDANPTEETPIVLEGISEVVTESVTTTVEKMDNDLIKAVQVTTTEVEVIYSQVSDVNSDDNNENNIDDSLDGALDQSKSDNTENI
jgi:hypothetical protein